MVLDKKFADVFQGLTRTEEQRGNIFSSEDEDALIPVEGIEVQEEMDSDIMFAEDQIEKTYNVIPIGKWRIELRQINNVLFIDYNLVSHKYTHNSHQEYNKMRLDIGKTTVKTYWDMKNNTYTIKIKGEKNAHILRTKTKLSKKLEEKSAAKLEEILD